MVSLTMFLLSAGNAIVSGLSLAFHHLILIYDSQSSNISIEIHAQILEKNQPPQILTHAFETFIRNLAAPLKQTSQKYLL